MPIFRRSVPRPAAADDSGIADAPGSSLLAIGRRRAAIGGELRAHVYRHADSKFLLVSIMSVPGSAMLETGEPSVLPFDAADDALGRSVCEHLLQHDARQPPDLRDRKLTDWAVFRASQESAVSGFESRSMRVAVATANLLLELEAAPLRSLHPEISVKGIAHPRHGELGATIRRSLAAVDALRQAGLV